MCNKLYMLVFRPHRFPDRSFYDAYARRRLFRHAMALPQMDLRTPARVTPFRQVYKNAPHNRV